MRTPSNGHIASTAEEFARAHQLQRAAVAAYGSRLAAASADEADTLSQQRRRIIAEQQTLSDLDHERVQQIISEYPALIRALRGEAP
ncbi:hypothetical protein [Streptomyces sp. NPDC059753]|uniref:hypothetical protein n=1 Tax=Streptomyces sp. NPDC059753 TaxID=3346933 RepID=UPI0036657B7B